MKCLEDTIPLQDMKAMVGMCNKNISNNTMTKTRIKWSRFLPKCTFIFFLIPIFNRFDGSNGNGMMDYNKAINNGCVEKTVQKGEYLYYVTQEGRDKPLESQCILNL